MPLALTKMLSISLSARLMLFAMAGDMLSARVMLVQKCALYARGRGRTMPDFREKFLGLKRCAARLRQSYFPRKMNDLDAEIIILAAVTMLSCASETRSEPCGCTAQKFCALLRPQRCAAAMLLKSLRRPSGCMRKRRKYSAGHQNASSLFIVLSVRTSARRQLNSPTGARRRATSHAPTSIRSAEQPLGAAWWCRWPCDHRSPSRRGSSASGPGPAARAIA